MLSVLTSVLYCTVLYFTVVHCSHLDVAGYVDLGVVGELEGAHHVVEEEVLASTSTRSRLLPVPYQLLLSETSILRY